MIEQEHRRDFELLNERLSALEKSLDNHSVETKLAVQSLQGQLNGIGKFSWKSVLPTVGTIIAISSVIFPGAYYVMVEPIKESITQLNIKINNHAVENGHPVMVSRMEVIQERLNWNIQTVTKYLDSIDIRLKDIRAEINDIKNRQMASTSR